MTDDELNLIEDTVDSCFQKINDEIKELESKKITPKPEIQELIENKTFDELNDVIVRDAFEQLVEYRIKGIAKGFYKTKYKKINIQDYNQSVLVSSIDVELHNEEIDQKISQLQRLRSHMSKFSGCLITKSL